VTVGEIASTKMAGDPALMELEESFAQTLRTVSGG
jgi:heat shock protein HslJ